MLVICFRDIISTFSVKCACTVIIVMFGKVIPVLKDHVAPEVMPLDSGILLFCPLASPLKVSRVVLVH